MNPNWDLSYLYKGFDDPAFLADLKRFPEEIKVEQAILDSGDDPQTKLEKLTDQQEVLGALSDRLSSFCSLTQAVDANNADATKYLNVLDVIFNDSRIVSSAVTRYIGGFANLEAAHRNGGIHPAHLPLVQMAHVLPQAALVDGANLLQKDDGILA